MLSVSSSSSRDGGRPLERQDLDQQPPQGSFAELLGGDVDRNHHAAVRQVRAGAPQDPLAQLPDEAGFLRQRYEVGWHQQSELRMLPAHKSLQPEQRRAAHVDDRLILDQELVVHLQRPLQRGEELATACDRILHAVLEDLEQLLAARLGHVHGRVRIAEHLVRRLYGVTLDQRVASRDADAGGEGRRALPELERDGQRGQDAPGDLLGAGAIGLLQQERELVAAQAAGRVLGAQDAHQPLGHEAQQIVTGRMSERVVDGLEVVQVNEQDGQACRLLPPNEGMRETVNEQDTIRQPGERIVERLVAKLILQVLAVSDIDEDPLHHLGTAVAVAGDDRLIVDDPHDVPVAGNEAVFPSALLAGALAVVDLGQDHSVAVAGVNAAHPERWIRDPLLRRVTEQLLDLGADEVPTAVLPGLGDIDHAGNALNDGPVLGLRHGELVRQLPLASDHSLPVGEQHGLPRHRKADDDRQGDARRQPKGPVQLRRGDQADDERCGDDHAGQRKQAAHERLGRQGNGGER